MEIGVARWLVQIKAAAYVIDCNWNMNGASIAKAIVPLVQYIRKTRPDTPIILAEVHLLILHLLILRRQSPLSSPHHNLPCSLCSLCFLCCPLHALQHGCSPRLLLPMFAALHA
jgi:hypothetical protein